MRWIVVQTKSNCEKKVTFNLIRQGYNVFFPKIKKSVVKFNKICNFIKPLFPGYLFVSLKENQSWSKINYTYGVFKILKFDKYLYYLPNDVFESIKSKCDRNDIFKKIESFHKGQKVKYRKNKFINMDAIFEENIDQNRSFIFINFLKQKVKARIETKYLESLA